MRSLTFSSAKNIGNFDNSPVRWKSLIFLKKYAVFSLTFFHLLHQPRVKNRSPKMRPKETENESVDIFSWTYGGRIFNFVSKLCFGRTTGVFSPCCDLPPSHKRRHFWPPTLLLFWFSSIAFQITLAEKKEELRFRIARFVNIFFRKRFPFIPWYRTDFLKTFNSYAFFKKLLTATIGTHGRTWILWSIVFLMGWGASFGRTWILGFLSCWETSYFLEDEGFWFFGTHAGLTMYVEYLYRWFNNDFGILTGLEDLVFEIVSFGGEIRYFAGSNWNWKLF